MSPLDPLGRLFDPAPGPPSVVYLVPLAVFLLLLVGSAVVYFLRRSLFPGQALHARIGRRYAGYGMIASAVGLILLAARYLDIYWLEMRFLLVLGCLGVLALAAHFGWYLRRRYPTDRALYERARERDRFARPSGHSARRRARKSRR